MATKRWEADAPAVKQKDVRTVGGSPGAGNTLTVTSALGAVYTYTLVAGDTTNTIAAASFVTDFTNNSQAVSQEFADVEVTSSGADVTFTARTAGKPFTFTYGATTSTFAAGSGGVANSGPEVFTTTANWGGANPSGSDDLVFDQGDVGAKYLVDQIPTLSGTLSISSTFTGDIGLGPTDDSGYVQHRARYLETAITLANIGAGDGQGSGRIWLYFRSAAPKVNIYRTGQGTDSNIEAVQIKGLAATTTFASIMIVDGELGLAIYGGDNAVVTSLLVGSQTTSPRVRGGIGCTVTGLSMASGTVILENAPSGTVTILDGTATFVRGGNITALNIDGGTCFLGGIGSSMTVTDCAVGNGATYDLSQGDGGVTHTNAIYVDAGGTIYDPRDRLATNTNIIPRGCSWNEITVITGINRTWRKVA